jgi:hypothetical protein
MSRSSSLKNIFRFSKNNRFERTKSIEVIDRIISNLKKSRKPLYLCWREYCSGMTVLVGKNSRQLTIGKPRDWDEEWDKIWVAFKDESRVLNRFPVKCTSSEDLIITDFPNYLIRHQRRSFFRVLAPRPNSASLRCEIQDYSGSFTIENLSVGGMLLKGAAGSELGLPVEDICLNFKINPGKQSNLRPCMFSVRKGEVVRYMNKKRQGFAIRFNKLSKNVEGKLQSFIRQIEMDFIRRGISPSP